MTNKSKKRLNTKHRVSVCYHHNWRQNYLSNCKQNQYAYTQTQNDKKKILYDVNPANAQYPDRSQSIIKLKN